MPLILGCLALFFPRIIIVLLVVFSDYIGSAYQTVLWPLLGFVFMPITTLAYALAINQHGSLSGFYLVLFVIAVLFDLGSMGGGGYTTSRTVVVSGNRRKVKNLAD